MPDASAIDDAYLGKVRASFRTDLDGDLPDVLVVSSDQAHWIDPSKVAVASRVGPLLDLPTRSFDLSLQEIPGHGATDLQRHAHEAVHYVLAGSGRSEIGARTCAWGPGDFIYTPVWVWHRHYNDGSEPARLLIVENAKLLEHLGLHRRRSAGHVDHATFRRDGARAGGE